MEVIRDERSPFGRQLAAYVEFWKRDHKAAMNCRDWEEAIAFGLSLYAFHQEREHLWREQVFRGIIAYSAQDDQTYRMQLQGWLEVADEVLRDCLPDLERDFGVVEGAAQLRSTAADARIHLMDWSPPRISQAVGLRDMMMTPHSAAELDRVLAEPPKPVPAGPIPANFRRRIPPRSFQRLIPLNRHMDTLQAVAFDPSMIEAVAGFDCGDESWQRDLAT